MSTTVAPGDTLWSLAARHLGDAYRWPELYYANKAAIVAEQRRRRLDPMQPEDWIFPGTVLEIP